MVPSRRRKRHISRLRIYALLLGRPLLAGDRTPESRKPDMARLPKRPAKRPPAARLRHERNAEPTVRLSQRRDRVVLDRKQKAGLRVTTGCKLLILKKINNEILQKAVAFFEKST